MSAVRYTPHMSPELLAIIGSAIALASIIVPGQRSIHRDIAELRDRMTQDNTDLRERMARLEGLFEGFTSRERSA